MKHTNQGLILNGRYIAYSFYFCLLTVFAVNLNGATLTVAPPPASIQTVINSALPGDTVQLSNGTYVEEIFINKNLTLNGNGIGLSIIQCPTTPNPLTNSFVFTTTGATYHPFVLVDGAANVVIQNLTVDGNSQASNFLSYRFEGIGYHNSGGTIQNVRSTNVQDQSPGGGTQHGFGIAGAVDDSNPHTINVLNCTVDNFQKAGIDMRGSTLTAVISSNTVTGETPFSTANANGIVVQFGAVATISSNTVTNLRSTVSGNDAVGILLSGAGAGSSITNNTSNSSDIGIYSANTAGDITISNNIVNNNTDQGIYVQDSAGVSTIQNNILTNNVNYNMYLYDTATNGSFLLGGNQFIGSQNGLGVQGNTTTGPVVTMDADSFTTPAVYYIREIAAPNDIWPSTASVSFDGLVSGHITLAQYNLIRTQILDQRSPVANPALGLVLDYIVPAAPIVTSVSPNSGLTSGGGTITITGSNFTSSDTEVFFGSIPGTDVVVVSDSSITVTVPAGSEIVDVTVVTPFGTSAITVNDEYTYVPIRPLHFRGDLDCHTLRAHWTASSSADIVSYRIYKASVLVTTISASSPRVFTARYQTRLSAQQYSVAAVDSAGTESAHTPIRLRH